MNTTIYLKIPQARLDIYEAAAVADLMGPPRLRGSQFLFSLEFDAEDMLDIENRLEALRSDLTDHFGPLVSDALMERTEERHDCFAEELEAARELAEAL